MASDDAERDGQLDPGVDRVTSLALLTGATAAVIAGAAIWLVLTDPVTVANSLESGEITPLVRQLAEVLYRALSGLLDYL